MVVNKSNVITVFVMLTVISTSPALSRLPIKLPEQGTKAHLWHSMFTFWYYTRGNWKVLSMVFYLSSRFTNPIMFDIILKNYLSSMLWHKFHEDIIIQTRKILFWIHVLFVYWKTQNFSRKNVILPFEKCAEH